MNQVFGILRIVTFFIACSASFNYLAELVQFIYTNHEERTLYPSRPALAWALWYALANAMLFMPKEF